MAIDGAGHLPGYEVVGYGSSDRALQELDETITPMELRNIFEHKIEDVRRMLREHANELSLADLRKVWDAVAVGWGAMDRDDRRVVEAALVDLEQVYSNFGKTVSTSVSSRS